jgi:hypothetical protein
MQRKVSSQTYSKDSFNLEESEFKKNFFPSNKKSNRYYRD